VPRPLVPLRRAQRPAVRGDVERVQGGLPA
jgi:hypothetical protein